MATLIHQFAIMTADPVFEPGERFTGCPPICSHENLPAFDTWKAADKWRDRFGKDPCSIREKWFCEWCLCWHYLTNPRPPSGYSSGGSKRSLHGPLGYVTLPPDKQQLAIVSGKKRFALRRKMGSVHKYGRDQNEHTVQKEILDIAAEIATGLILGIEWVYTETPDYQGDLGNGVEVRWTAINHLIIRPNDLDNHYYFMVTGDFPEFHVHGWVSGARGKRIGRLWKPDPSRPECYTVEPSHLNSLTLWHIKQPVPH